MKKSYYKKVDYPERACVICGKMFKPKRCTTKTCGSTRCKNKLQANQRKEWARQNYKIVKDTEKARETVLDAAYGHPEEPKPRRKSNIIAIGYAERQIARSLELAGKVNTEL